MNEFFHFPSLRLRILGLCVLLCLTLTAYGKHLRIEVTAPGNLAVQVADHDASVLTELTVSGRLNGDDLRCLRALAGGGYDGNPAEGPLRSLDLAGATFVKGGGCYMDNGTKRYVKSAGTLPPYLFNNTQIEALVLPDSVSILGEHSLEQTRLRRIRLPEQAVIEADALRHNPQLEEVIFPKTTCAIHTEAFSDCPKLREISINNVLYVSARSFCRMESLKHWEVRGWLGHMDGWYTIDECPQLESIDFRGPVFSTGGDVTFTHCPQLQKVTFHDVVWNTCFGKAEGCTAFQGYVAESLVCSSQETDYIPATPQPEQDARYPKALKKAYAIYQEISKIPNGLSSFRLYIMSGPFFQAAVQSYRKGEGKEGAAYLDIALRSGYSQWEQFYQDTAELAKFIPAEQIERIEKHLEAIRSKEDYLYILQHTPPYRTEDEAREPFTYTPPSDSLLRAIRKHFNLDSIAGEGNDEIAQIKNIMYWLHDKIRHDGQSNWPDCPYNAIDLIELARREGRGYNCRFLAMILNDLYLAMGFPSRFLTCQPKAYDTDPDCHVINMVWSRTLGKWVWMDPSFAAYVTDENGLLLHPGEVRARLISGAPLILNEDANWNHKQKQTKEYYLEHYMAKNLYLLSAHLRSESETENLNRSYKTPIVVLTPEGFDYHWSGILTADSAYFWQAPPQEDSIEVHLTGTVSLPEGSGTARLLVAESAADLRLGGTREVPVADGRFDFRLRLPCEQALVLLADLPGQPGNPAPFFAEAGATLHIDYSARVESRISGGGPLNEAYRAYLRTMREKQKAYRPIEQKQEALEQQGRLYSPAGKALTQEWETKASCMLQKK